MTGWSLVLIAVALIAYATISRRIEGTVITPAILFVAFGYLVGPDGLGWFEGNVGSGTIRSLAEATLALVLFSDASALDTRALQRELQMPTRLLAVGLPLTIILGALVAVPLFPDLGVFEAVALAILLAPTDAALGQAVVSDSRLPSRLRQGLNVESGLNDGVCVPLLFAALTFAELDEAPAFDGSILVDFVEELATAIAVGAVVASVVAFAVQQSMRRGWMDHHLGQIVPPAAAAAAYAATSELGGSGFIACFVAGLLYGRLLGPPARHSTQLLEEVGQVLSSVTFFVFAAVMVGPALADLDAATVAYAVSSLTLIRMVPVAIGLVGSRAAPATVAFAGWFGPRGLASIVFALIVVEESGLPGTELIVRVTTLTVLLSVVAHGVTATPLTSRYARWIAARRPELTLESEEVETLVVPRGLARRRARSAAAQE
jgi:NhaP-type Na+/H+ or K+/H+ antiporter